MKIFTIVSLKQIYILIFLFISFNCYPELKNREINQMDTIYIISETDQSIKYISNLLCYYHEDNTFDLDVELVSKQKEQDVLMKEGYAIEVAFVEDNYKLRSRMESATFYQNGINVGHADPSGIWTENDSLSFQILDYYLSHKDLVYTSVPPEFIDISRFKPLLMIDKNRNNQSHILKLHLHENPQLNKYFSVDCEILSIQNALLNNKIFRYSISRYTYYFTPKDGQYEVKIQHKSTQNYKNGDKDISGPLHLSKDMIKYSDEDIVAQKMLEYLLYQGDIK